MAQPTAEKTQALTESVPAGYAEEMRSIISRAKHQADEILEKARALLREARSVQGSRDLDFEENRAEARKIGFDEGFRLGRERGQVSAEQDTVLGSLSQDAPEAVAALEKAALRLLDERSDFEADKRRFIGGIRGIVEGAPSSDEDLSATLLQFLKEHPPSVALEVEEPPVEANARPGRRREGRARSKNVVADRNGVRAGDR